MADYYHTARKAKRDLKDVADDNKRRRLKRQELGLEGPDVEHPLNLLTIDGRGCKLIRNKEQHAALEREDSLIPWNGDTDNLIDRFDARSLLDFYREPAVNAQRSKSSQDEKLQELLIFESYRDMVRLIARGLTEEAALKVASNENLEVRAQRRGAAAAAFRVQSHQTQPGDADTAAGTGMYSAVGFSYGGQGASGGTADVSSSSSDDDDDDDDDNRAGPGPTGDEAEQEKEQERLDVLAERFGIPNFSYRLHRAQIAEGDMEEAWRWKPRKRKGRKAARERARRMAGQGLDPQGHTLTKDWRDPVASSAPSALLTIKSANRGESQSGTGSESESPTRRDGSASLMHSLPSVKGTNIDRKAFLQRDDEIVDALPDMPDPALSGAQHFPAATALHSIMQQQEARRRERSREREQERERDRGRGRSRSRSRGRGRSRSRSRSRERRIWRRRSRSRSRSRDRVRDRGRVASARTSGGSSQTAAGFSRPTGVTSAANAGGASKGTTEASKVETPAERLKRIMNAQLNKQLSKDSALATQKKIQAEKDKAARSQLVQQARAVSPRRGRSRSRSPRRDRY